MRGYITAWGGSSDAMGGNGGQGGGGTETYANDPDSGEYIAGTSYTNSKKGDAGKSGRVTITFVS